MWFLQLYTSLRIDLSWGNDILQYCEYNFKTNSKCNIKRICTHGNRWVEREVNKNNNDKVNHLE